MVLTSSKKKKKGIDQKVTETMGVSNVPMNFVYEIMKNENANEEIDTTRDLLSNVTVNEIG